MRSTVDIHDIIRFAISKMNTTVQIKSVTDNGDETFTIEACQTLWIMEDMYLQNEEFIVTEVKTNEEFTVKRLVPGAVFPSDMISIDPPKYFHGTVINTNNELNKIYSGREKFPMIYCLEIFREVFTTDPEDATERISNVRLFFLGSNNFKDWITEDHYDKVIKPLRNMVDQFIHIVNNRNGFGFPDDFTTVNHVNFGTYAQDNGKIAGLFDDNLSGIEVDISLNILKKLTCENFCDDC